MLLDFKRAPRAAWRRLGITVGLIVLFALFGAAQNYASQLVSDFRVPLHIAFRRSAEEWGIWTVFAILILFLCDRVPFDRPRLRRGLAIHGVGCVLVSVVYLACLAGVLHGQYSVDGTRFVFGRIFEKLLIHYACLTIIMYWVIVLAHMGWLYYQRFHERERAASALATELVQARLDALRIQLNPHFLFNTLHTISAMIHENPALADHMVVRLSDLLRQTLDKSQKQLVPLRQELAFLHGYLDIVKTRFQDRLEVQMQIEPAVEEFEVPFLILQPLVENAVRHGVEMREAAGRIGIAARQTEDWLELKVTDNGPGMPEDPAARREGIGIANVRARLLHLYGTRQRFELNPADGGGLEVRLLLPCHPPALAPEARVVVMACSPEQCTEIEPARIADLPVPRES